MYGKNVNETLKHKWEGTNDVDKIMFNVSFERSFIKRTIGVTILIPKVETK
jgi:hypothetical protein